MRLYCILNQSVLPKARQNEMTVRPPAGPGQSPDGGAGGKTPETLKYCILFNQTVPFLINCVFSKKDMKQLR